MLNIFFAKNKLFKACKIPTPVSVIWTNSRVWPISTLLLTLILLDPRFRNLRLSSLDSASTGTESKKLEERSSSTRLFSSGRKKERWGEFVIAGFRDETKNVYEWWFFQRVRFLFFFVSPLLSWVVGNEKCAFSLFLSFESRDMGDWGGPGSISLACDRDNDDSRTKNNPPPLLFPFFLFWA